MVLFVFTGVFTGALRGTNEALEEPKRSGEGDDLDCVGVEEGVSIKLNSQLNGSSGEDGRATTLAQDILKMVYTSRDFATDSRGILVW